MKKKFVSENIILSLIRDDLRNFRLINSLTAIGLDATDHHLELSTTIFNLLDIEVTPTDTYMDSYVSLSGLAQYISLNDPDKELENMAIEVYNFLKALPKNTSLKN